MMRDVLNVETVALDERTDPGTDVLPRLFAPPDGGFLVSLVDPDTAAPPAQLMRIGSVTL
jgi:hypothetical protein